MLNIKLYIRVENGQPLGNPIVEANMRQAFPEVDLDNLPPEFARFTRIPRPQIGRFEIYDGVTYEWNGAAFTDVHHVRPMTSAEKQTIIDELQATSPGEGFIWDEERVMWRIDAPIPDQPYPSWIWNDDAFMWESPIPAPLMTPTSPQYVWDEAAQNWVLVND